MERCGASALALHELIAILLGSGTRGKDVMTLSQELVVRFGGVEGLSGATLEELCEVKGLGRSKALQLQAALALGNRVPKMPDYPLIGCPKDAYLYLRDLFSSHQEQVALLLRDVKGRALRRLVVFQGTLDSVQAHPREIFAPVLEHRAASFLLAHNHPSGDPTPSQPDLHLTRRLIEGAHLLRLALDDHLILGREEFHSFYAAGLFPSRPAY